MIGVNNHNHLLIAAFNIAWNFLSSTALYTDILHLLSNGIKGHKMKLISVRLVSLESFSISSFSQTKIWQGMGLTRKTLLCMKLKVWDFVLGYSKLPKAPGGRGAGVLNKCLYGEAPPRGPTPYPFIYHFSRKRYPFRIPSIDKWYPFHIPCLELCIPFNCCKCTVF